MRVIPAITLVLLSTWIPARTAQACLTVGPGLYALGWISGVPDAQGMLHDMPNTNQIAEGDDILLGSTCGECPIDSFTVTLTNAAGQTRATTLEQIKPGTHWRLHPTQPLAAGQYTLKTQYLGAMPVATEGPVTFVFKVQGNPENTQPLEFDVGLSTEIDIAGVSAGSLFTCDERNSCGTQTTVYTQWRPRVDVLGIPRRTPTKAESAAYLYRALPADMPGASDQVTWLVPAEVGALQLWVSSLEQKPEYCVELEALRVRDLTRMSLGKHCVTYKIPDAPYDPVQYRPCKMPNPTAYARAWCKENLAACSASNPRADREQVRMACADYPSICAPLIGNRSPEDRYCGP